jgi:hypothetical protein
MLNECFDPLKMIDEIISGGYKSEKLDAYLGLRRLVVQKLGDNAAPLLSVTQIREGMINWIKAEITRNYKHCDKMRAFASLFYKCPIEIDTPLSQVVEMSKRSVGTDFGITDLDQLGELFCSVTGKKIEVVGSMLSYGNGRYGYFTANDIPEMVRACGGKL